MWMVWTCVDIHARHPIHIHWMAPQFDRCWIIPAISNWHKNSASALSKYYYDAFLITSSSLYRAISNIQRRHLSLSLERSVVVWWCGAVAGGMNLLCLFDDDEVGYGSGRASCYRTNSFVERIGGGKSPATFWHAPSNKQWRIMWEKRFKFYLVNKLVTIGIFVFKF